MKVCPRCNSVNDDTGRYCGSCGGPLEIAPTQSVGPTVVSEQGLPTYRSPYATVEEYKTPPPPILAIPSQSHLPSHMTPFSPLNQYAIPKSPKGRTPLGTVCSTLLYIVGSSLACFGLFGVLTAFIDNTTAVVIMLSVFLLSILGLAAIIGLYRFPYLRWWQRLLGVGINTVLSFIFLIIGAALMGSQPSENMRDVVYGGIILLYGLIATVLSVW